MKFSALALIAGASAANFPGFDSFHASCQFETVSDKSCADTYTTLQGVLSDFETNNTDPAHGFYAKKQVATRSQLWYTRLTGGKKYTDDMEYLLSDTSAGCKITANSRSQSLSYYDYYTNYCNIYNPLRQSTLNFSEPQTTKCKYAPAMNDRSAACDAN